MDNNKLTMDTLKNKQYATFNYLSRYTTVPFYFDTLKNRNVFGIGTNLKKDTEFVAYKVKQSDNLDLLALKYYNNPSFWWVIAYFNDIMDALTPLTVGTIIKIPSIASIEFGEIR